MRPFLLALCALAAGVISEHASAQGSAVKLDISRRNLKNFLTDEAALQAYRPASGELGELLDVFTFGSVDLPYAIFWDPQACRLIGVLHIDRAKEMPQPAGEKSSAEGRSAEPSPPGNLDPYLFKAQGPFPLSKTRGIAGPVRYFGFRLVDGAPEFLYTCGSYPIEERLWLDEGGRVLRQRFFVKDPPATGLQIAVPDAWTGRVQASIGTWKGSLLVLPKDSSEVVLSYPLAPQDTSSQENN